MKSFFDIISIAAIKRKVKIANTLTKGLLLTVSILKNKLNIIVSDVAIISAATVGLIPERSAFTKPYFKKFLMSEAIMEIQSLWEIMF